MKKVLVIGSLNYDTTVYVKDFPATGETIGATSYAVSLGGKGANQAVAISKLGLNASVIGKVGDDSEGMKLITELQKFGVNTDNVLTHGSLTGKAFITVKDDGKNTIVVVGGANQELSIADVLTVENYLMESDAVLLQLEIPLETVKFSLELARKKGKLTILNPAPAVRLDADILKNVDILIPNETELNVVSGMNIETRGAFKEACHLLTEKGVKIVIVTLGSKGCAVFMDGDLNFYDAVKADVVDTTAAGDSFIGGFLSSYLNDKVIEVAVEFAQKVAAVTVSKRGALVAIPTLQEVEFS